MIDWGAIGKEHLHELQREILEQLDTEGELSAVELRRRSTLAQNYGLSTVSYHFTCLFKQGWILATKQIPRRGAVEHFYGLAPKAKGKKAA